MRLTKQQIEDLSRIVLKRISAMELVTINAPDEKVRQRIIDIIAKDMAAEDDLDREVKRILEAYEADFKSGKMEYMKMFNKVKDKLVKEREMII